MERLLNFWTLKTYITKTLHPVKAREPPKVKKLKIGVAKKFDLIEPNWVYSFSSFIRLYQTRIVSPMLVSMIFNLLDRVFIKSCSNSDSDLKIWNFSDFSDPIVEFTNFVSRVWTQIVERVVVRFDWNFNTIIWHLYVFFFATWKNFPITGDFPRVEKRENEAVFLTLQKTVNLYEIFYVMKVMGKILWGVFLIGRIVNFNFHTFLEFFDFRFERG